MTDRGAVSTARRLGFVVPWVVLAATGLAVGVFGAPTRQSQLLVFAVSIVAFGLPHGAVDHLTPSWARGEPSTRRLLAIVGGLYLVVGLAYAGVWFLSPVVGFVSFILLTWVHWGQGELHPLVDLLAPTHLRTRAARLLTLAARGSLPMALPLVAFPGDYRWVAERLVGLFAVEPAALDPLFAPTGRLGVAAVVGTLVVASLGVGYAGSVGRQAWGDGTARRAWTVDAAETLLLVVYFLTVPPILAVGVFFCCWHSVRHIVRLVLLDNASADRLAAGDLRGVVARFGRQATPLSVGGLAVVGGLALAVPVAPVDPADLFAVYLVGIAVLTAPHIVVVTWLDWETGIWRRAGGDR